LDGSLLPHIVHFSVINPAAWIFGIFFILQGLLFLPFRKAGLSIPLEKRSP